MPKKVNDGDGNLIPDRRKNNNNKYFKLVIPILVAAIGWLFIMNSRADNKIERVQSGYTEIKVQLSRIEESICWIKDNLKEMRR